MTDPDIHGEIHRVSAAMDAELRAEQAEYEAMALLAELRARGLADVVRELMVRGDVVEVTLGEVSLSGTVSHTGEDFAVLGCQWGEVDLVLATLSGVRVLHRERRGVNPPSAGSRTFRARLTEHEIDQTAVVLKQAGRDLQGLIAAVATDHIVLQTGTGTQFIPLASIVAAWPQPA